MANLETDWITRQKPVTGDSCIPPSDVCASIDNEECLRDALVELQRQVILLGAGSGGNVDPTEAGTVNSVPNTLLNLGNYSECSVATEGSMRVCVEGGPSSDPQNGDRTVNYSYVVTYYCDGAVVGSSNVSGSQFVTGNDTVCIVRSFAATAFSCAGILTADIVGASNFASYDNLVVTANAYCVN